VRRSSTLALVLIAIACGPGRVVGPSETEVGDTGESGDGDGESGDGDGESGDGDGESGDGDGESGDGDGNGESGDGDGDGDGESGDGDGDGDGESGDGDGDGEPPPDLPPEGFCGFADPYLEAIVVEELGLQRGPVPVALAETVTQLVQWASGPEPGEHPVSLTGIECLSNLVTLRLPPGSIDDLTPLSELSSLAVLRVHNNQISQLQPLAGLPNLTWLELPGNPIPDGALVDIAELPLISLDVSDTAITTLDDFLLFEDLLALHINNLPIDDLSPLYGSGIVTLGVVGTNIADLASMPSWGPLACLHLQETPAVDLSPLLEVTWVVEPNLCGTCPRLGVTTENLDDYSNAVVIPTLCEMGINVNGCLFCPQ
jgi:hypothetical protein